MIQVIGGRPVLGLFGWIIDDIGKAVSVLNKLGCNTALAKKSFSMSFISLAYLVTTVSAFVLILHQNIGIDSSETS